MPRSSPGRPKAVVFDLDTTVIDRRRAWQYAVEEAVLTVTGERMDAAPLVDEYHRRPWAHASDVLLQDPAARLRCAEVCEQYFRRSALKRLLVFEGIGMALDRLRGEWVEMGGITRERHADAMRQIESTGTDRFLAVLAPTNDGAWDPVARFEECVAYLEASPGQVVFVSASRRDAELVAETGASALIAAWGQQDPEAGALAHPSDLSAAAAAAISGA